MTGEKIKNIRIRFNHTEIDRYYTSKSSSFYFQQHFWMEEKNYRGFRTGNVFTKTIDYTVILNEI